MTCACAMLSRVPSPALLYFSTISHNQHDFQEGNKVPEHEMRVLSFSAAFI